MKLNPPGSSSDLETAKAIASRLSVAAYGRRGARKPTAAAAITTHVEPAAPPLGQVVRVTAPPAPVAPPPVAARAAEPDVIPERPQPSPEALAPHEEPPLAEAPVPEARSAEPAPPPPPAPSPETRQDSGSFTLHKPSRSRVDALLEQALGRAAALPSHHKEPASHEPFVPIPAATPDSHATEPAPPPAEPHAEPPIAASTADQRAQWEAFVPAEPGSPREERTNPSFRVPDEAREGSAEPGEDVGVDTAAAEEIGEPAAVTEPPVEDVAVPVSEEPPPSREAFGAEEAAPEPPFGVEEEPPIPVETEAFGEPPAAEGNVFDPSALVGAEAPAPEPPAPEPPPPPSWPEVLDRCLHVATTARGALVAGANGRLIASAGHWPAKAEVISSKLVPLIEKSPRPATEEPLPIKLGPNVLSSWQFPVEGELYTAAFVGEAALPAHVWPELKAALRR